MPMGRMRVLAPDVAIMRRREMEDRLVSAKTFVQDQQKVTSAAAWEEKAGLRGERLDRAREAEDQEAAKQADLARRAELLAEKLRKEERDIQEAILKKTEEAGRRRLNLVDKAQERSALREAERQRLVTQLRDLQFKESCDAIRTKQSHQRQQACIQQQEQQVEEAKRERAAQQQGDRAFDQRAMTSDANMVAGYEASLKARRDKYLELRALLDEQVSQHEQLNKEEADRKARESQNLQVEWENQAAMAKAAAEQQSLLQKTSYDEMQKLNRDKLAEKAAIQSAERLADENRLKATLKQEAKVDMKEQAAKARSKEAALRHRVALEAMLSKDVIHSEESDGLIEQASKAQQAQEDASRAATNAARAKLLAEVSKTRLEQIHQHALCKEQLAGDRRAELDRLEQQDAEIAALELAEAEKLRNAELQYRMELEAQMAAKQQAQAREKLAAAQAVLEAQQAEQEYQQRTEAILRSSDAQTDFRRKKVEWFN